MTPADQPPVDDSPCVHVCLMDYEQGLCIGCYRTLDEITYWVKYTGDQKREVLAMLNKRRFTVQFSN